VIEIWDDAGVGEGKISIVSSINYSFSLNFAIFFVLISTINNRLRLSS
jgi:hypothetical protein